MAEVTYFVALPFVAADDGIAAGEPTECFNPNAAVMRAEALSHKEGHVGAVAFSRTGDPATGDFGDARVIRKFGDVPDVVASHGGRGGRPNNNEFNAKLLSKLNRDICHHCHHRLPYRISLLAQVASTSTSIRGSSSPSIS